MNTRAAIVDRRQLVSRSGVVAAGTLLSRVTGLVRLVVILAVLGGGLLGDTYNAANNMPNIVYELLVGGIITATLVPLFVEAHADHDDRAVSALFTVALCALAALTVLGVALAPLIARLFAQPQSYGVAVALVVCFMPQMLFYGFVSLAGAALNARRRFVAAAFAPVVNNVFVIALFGFIAWKYGSIRTVQQLADDRVLLALIGVGTTVGIVMMAFVLLPSMSDVTRWRPVFEWRHPAVRRMLRLSGWMLGYVAANQLALAIVLRVASRKPGEWVAYNAAYQFFQLPYGLFAVTIMTALAPELASAWHAQDRPWFRRDFARGLRFLLLVIVPSSVGLAVVAEPVVALLQRGSFDGAAVARTADALAGFAIGLVPFCVYLYALRGFYAMGDTQTPFVVNLFENLLNVALALALHPRGGVRGLAIAFSLAYAIAAIGALGLLRRRMGGLADGAVLGVAARAVAAASGAGLVAWLLVGRGGAPSGPVALAVATAAASVVYVAGLLATGNRDVMALVALARRRPV